MRCDGRSVGRWLGGNCGAWRLWPRAVQCLKRGPTAEARAIIGDPMLRVRLRGTDVAPGRKVLGISASLGTHRNQRQVSFEASV